MLDPAEFDIAEKPVKWIILFPLGLLVLAVLCIIIAASWPPYLVYRFGKWAYYLGSDV